MVIILAVFLILAFLPLITPDSEELYRIYLDSDLDEGFYRYVDVYSEKGRVSLSFTADKPLTAFIMTEAQFYSYQNSFSTDALVTKISSYTGTISWSVNEPQNLFFIISNDGSRTAEISEFVVDHIGEKQSLLQFIFGDSN